MHGRIIIVTIKVLCLCTLDLIAKLYLKMFIVKYLDIYIEYDFFFKYEKKR